MTERNELAIIDEIASEEEAFPGLETAEDWASESSGEWGQWYEETRTPQVELALVSSAFTSRVQVEQYATWLRARIPQFDFVIEREYPVHLVNSGIEAWSIFGNERGWSGEAPPTIRISNPDEYQVFVRGWEIAQWAIWQPREEAA